MSINTGHGVNLEELLKPHEAQHASKAKNENKVYNDRDTRLPTIYTLQ